MSQEEANQIVREAHRRRRMLRPPMRVVLPVAAALGAGAAVAVAAIPDSGGVIHGCYLTDTSNNRTDRIGALRVVDPSLPGTIPGAIGPNPAAACLADEASITWAQTGPQGPPGVTGPTGPPGNQGINGVNGVNGTNLVGQTSFGLSGGGKTFLKLGDIKGESKDSVHKDQIDLSSVAFTAGGAGSSAHGSGGGEGKTSFHDLSFTHKIDKASPVLFQAAATGKHFATATVSFAKVQKGKQSDYLILKMNDVIVSSVSDGVNGSDTPTESVTLNFAKVSETYYATDPKGKKLAGVTVSVNVSSTVKLR